MDINITEIEGTVIAKIIAESVVIRTGDDAVNLIGNCAYQGAEKIMVHEKQLSPLFFDLKTGLAGEVLQKFSTYRMALTITGDFSKYTSQALKDFIYESNKGHSINFVQSSDETAQH
ncbi:MAG TPA: DUF4180 domain-containing protein [Cytophagales bacterium]|nr:DUF4180 domain-containing protein [Cytophagales bacterium]